MLALVLIPAAAAFTPAGFGVPELGGALAGVERDGAYGVFTNPAAAHPDRGQWLVDVGWMYSDLQYTLDLDDDFGLRSQGATLVPSIAGAEPIGPVGLGISFVPLYARGGGDGGPEDGAQRFHTVRGGIQLLELSVSAAVAVHPAWTIGGAFRYGTAKMSSFRALDSGALIGGLAPDADVPIGYAFLEGTQELDDHSGFGLGGTAGLRFAPERGTGFSFSFRSAMTPKVHGGIELVPSSDLEISLTAEADTEIPFPPAAFLAVDIPVGRVNLVPELSWIGWSSYYSFETELSELELGSEDDAVVEILDAYDLTKAEFLEGSTSTVSLTGMHDVVNVGASVWVPVGDDWNTRFGLWYLPSAVPDGTAHPGNLDFDSIDARGAVAWTPLTWLTLGLGADWFWSPTRFVRTSLHSQTDPEPPGARLPSGNGTYRLTLARLGLSAVFSHGPIVPRREL